jgi:hypothetical protein
MMRRRRGDDFAESLLLLSLYTLIGIGPLFASLVMMQGYFPPEDPASLVASSPVMFWLLLVMLGCVLGWTLSGLAVDYERFWRLPGRLQDFERIVADHGDDVVMQAVQTATEGSVSVLRYRWLRSHGINVWRVAPLTFAYVSVRGAWLGAVVSVVVLGAEAFRTLFVDVRVGVPTVLGLAGSGVAFFVGSWLSRRLGRSAAQQVVSAIRKQDAINR